jgi:hypothetical protein
LIIAISARGHLVAHRVHAVGGVQRQQAGLVDHAARFGDAFMPDRLLGQRLAERDAALQAVDHQFQRTLGRADGAHAVVDAPGPEAPLGDLEAAAFAQQDVGWPAPARCRARLSMWPCGASS